MDVQLNSEQEMILRNVHTMLDNAPIPERNRLIKMVSLWIDMTCGGEIGLDNVLMQLLTAEGLRRMAIRCDLVEAYDANPLGHFAMLCITVEDKLYLGSNHFAQ